MPVHPPVHISANATDDPARIFSDISRTPVDDEVFVICFGHKAVASKGRYSGLDGEDDPS